MVAKPLGVYISLQWSVLSVLIYRMELVQPVLMVLTKMMRMVAVVLLVACLYHQMVLLADLYLEDSYY